MKPKEDIVHEQDLLDGAIAGDSACFERLIAPYEKIVFNIAYRMFNNTQDAQDVSQEILIKVYRNLRKYNGTDGGSFKRWVYTIANNACIDEIRRRKARISPESLDSQTELQDGTINRQFESSEDSPEAIILGKERRMQIKSAIEALAPEYRQMIVLRDITGLSYEEICEVTGNKMGTVKSKISRARGKLKSLLDGK